ncbi:MgtC/SapB family protein [Methyloligella sp. 2.7D]|uniref:MgtC/SapB family protein n=1 Tax=unclassified Methyloligella TaxID=2625955 RepID=UPI00157DFD80|nr:MgtC/SapB family protein [Methyloligella sp. GL2]QKP77022.1 MgtC/SapB family protein [Methyloligella sp. GL2]
MERQALLSVALNFAIAILLGALVGIEREKRKGSGKKSDGTKGDLIAGLRTFTLLSLAGAASGWLAKDAGFPWLLPATFLLVGGFVLVGYFVTAREDEETGLTTEIAALVVFLLGAMVMLGYRELAIGLAVVTAAVLAYKRPLHNFVAKLGWPEVFAGLRLLIASFIALPLLPDRTIDPWGAINPYLLWLLVILISGLSLVGYLLTRLLGPGRGTALTGLSGGLVSSTAVALSFAKQSREKPQLADALACGIMLSWVAMFGRILVAVGIVNWSLFMALLWPVVAMGAVTAGFAAWLYWRSQKTGMNGEAAEDLQVKNPFNLLDAAKFAALFAVVLLAVNIVQQDFPPQGMYVVAALAGLTDVDAITLSMAEVARNGDMQGAVIAIVVAALSNTLVKVGIVTGLGDFAVAKRVMLATAAIIATGLGAALLWVSV